MHESVERERIFCPKVESDRRGSGLSPTPEFTPLAFTLLIHPFLLAVFSESAVKEMGKRKHDANDYNFNQVLPETTENRFEHHSIRNSTLGSPNLQKNANWEIPKNRPRISPGEVGMVEPRGVEPLTFSLRTRRSTN